MVYLLLVSILIWGSAVNSPPTGYLVCDGSAVFQEKHANLFAAVGTTHGSGNGSTTFNLPDLRDKFVVGASGTKSVAATGGSADAIVVSHTHTATVTDNGHSHTVGLVEYYGTLGSEVHGAWRNGSTTTSTATTGITVSNSTTGSSGTGANLPPYYAFSLYH